MALIKQDPLINQQKYVVEQAKDGALQRKHYNFSHFVYVGSTAVPSDPHIIVLQHAYKAVEEFEHHPWIETRQGQFVMEPTATVYKA